MIYFTKIEGTRLGNWMFQYAAALTLAGEGEVGCYLEDGDILCRIEGHPFFERVKFVREAPDVETYEEPVFTYRPLPQPGAAGLCLRGYFQSPKYFDRARVLREFAPDEGRVRQLREKYAEAFRHDDLTSISVRRGDYLLYPHQFPFVGRRYYVDALARHPETRHFLVCSDDLSWCRRFFTERRFPGRTFYFSEGSDAIDDLYLTSLCRNNILSNSSFSWWGGYLNANPGKFTVAPSRWFGYDLVRNKGLTPHDLYYEGTEIVANEYSRAGYLATRVYEFWFEVVRKKVVSPIYQRLKGVVRG